MTDLPAGTVTFLFTDIEGSTKLLDELGDSYGDALTQHRGLLRAAFRAHGGAEVDAQGDAFFVAFARATDAGRAALDAQKALEGSRVRVRMGLHTGEPLIRDGGYVGMDVHRGARVMSAGHGGQIVVSERTQSFLGDDLPLRELGVHRLKDLRKPERLYQLGSGEFPPLRTIDATNLPFAATQLLGRERELGEIVSLLSNGARLVTVTGPGGTGKTRFALEAAAEFVGQMRDGVFWVPLAGVASPDLVLPEIAQALGTAEDMQGFLRDREVLILLDNLEHLLEAAPGVAQLLSECARLKVLATSRAPLRVAGEHEFPLDPLGREDAATLFCERARAVGRDLSPDETVDAICRRLDGLPLAIELAAARTKLFAAQKLLDRLERTLPLLTSGSRDAPDRQRTLRATIEWSFELLDDDAKRLFARLSVFAGSFSFAAAEAVCKADVDGIAALVDLSLLKTIGDDRFLMLETMREYAAEELEASPEGQSTRGNHARFFAQLAEDVYERRINAESESAATLELEHDDLRAALDWLADHDAESELAVAGALAWFWVTHSHLQEGSNRLDHALARAEDVSRVAARALTGSAAIAGQLGRAARADAQYSDAIQQWRELGDDNELASTFDQLGWSLFFRDDIERALETFEQCLDIRRKLKDQRGEMRALIGVCQGLVAKREIDRAEQLSQELLVLAQRDGDLRSEHFADHFLADCALMRHDYEEAERRYGDSLRAAIRLGDVTETSLEVQGMAMAAAGQGDLRRATLLGGAVEALWEASGVVIDVEFWNALLEEHIGTARSRLGSEGDSVWGEGRALPFERAVELALEPD